MEKCIVVIKKPKSTEFDAQLPLIQVTVLYPED